MRYPDENPFSAVFAGFRGTYFRGFLLRESQNVICPAGLTVVPKFRKLFNESAFVSIAVHFADDSRTPFVQQPLRSAKHFHFHALHVTFEKIRRRVRASVIIE